MRVPGETQTELGQVQNALQRYIKSVEECGKQAKKAHWETDDRRFVSCVCPLTDKWRLPKVGSDLRVHQPLPEKTGFSITVTATGRVKDCRVWVGARSPEDSVDGRTFPADGNHTIGP